MCCDKFEGVNIVGPEVCFNCRKFEHDDSHGPRCEKFPVKEHQGGIE